MVAGLFRALQQKNGLRSPDLGPESKCAKAKPSFPVVFWATAKLRDLASEPMCLRKTCGGQSGNRLSYSDEPQASGG